MDEKKRKCLASFLKYWSRLKTKAMRKGQDRELLMKMLSLRAAADSLRVGMSVEDFLTMAFDKIAESQNVVAGHLPDWMPGASGERVRVLEDQSLEAERQLALERNEPQAQEGQP